MSPTNPIKYFKYGMPRFLALALVSFAVLRIFVIGSMETMSERRVGDFEVEALFDSVMYVLAALALLYIIYMVISSSLSHISLTRKPVIINLICIWITLFFCKQLLPGIANYIDFILSPYLLGFSLLYGGIIKKSGLVVTISFLVLLLTGLEDGSKASVLTFIFAILYLIVSGQLKFSRKVVLWGAATAPLFLFVTMQMVAIRAMGRTFNSSELASIFWLTIDTISQRFNFIDGIYLAERSAPSMLPPYDFLNNLFVYLPFVSPRGRTMGEYVSCEIERNCVEHSGALGLPAVLLHFDNVLLLIFLFITFFSAIFFMVRVFNPRVNHTLMGGLCIYLSLISINIFLSGNLDIIFSETFVILVNFSVLNHLLKLTVRRKDNAYTAP